MFGVALDAMNLAGRASPQLLHSIGVTGYRMELRAEPPFWTYYSTLKTFNSALLIGPSSKFIEEGLQQLRSQPPNTIIIGNEPDGQPDSSSWAMTPQEYATLYNLWAPKIRFYLPKTRICTAGMIGDTTYLSKIWLDLDIKPDRVNKHYPDNTQELRDFEVLSGVPCIIGEWCYYTANTLEEMKDWTQQIYYYDNYWFCLSNQMVQDYGLRSHDKYTKAGRLYRQAIA